tara:strand:+ start:376 stop:606 length:231 start_codon:yes stop_codon:yes gene_type:complete
MPKTMHKGRFKKNMPIMVCPPIDAGFNLKKYSKSGAIDPIISPKTLNALILFTNGKLTTACAGVNGIKKSPHVLLY